LTVKRSELFVLPSSISKLFLPNGTENPNVDNIDYYPRHLQPFYGNLHIINANTSTIGEDSFGNLVVGWNPNQRNFNLVTDIVNNFPRHMLQNLVVIAGKDGTAIPVAGSYFTKMMDHEPGTIEPFSCLITDENGDIVGLNFTSSITIAGLVNSGTNTGDQNLFSTIAVAGQSNVVADTTSDTLTLVAGSGIAITTNASTDTITIASTGGGGSKTYGIFTPLDNQPPATNYATIDTRNSIMTLDFDAATREEAVFVSVIPEAAVLGSGLTARINWTATTATTGNCVWGIQYEKMNTDIDSDSFATAATTTSATNATSGIITTTTITTTNIDGLAAGDPYRLKVFRDAANGSDTMTGDAELISVEVRSGA